MPIKDLSLSAIVAGLLAVLISYAGPLVIVFHAAKAANYSTEFISSWIWAISIGSGVTGVILSWRLKVPIINAWSTPGAALLIGVLPSLPVAEAVGAYMVAAGIITVIGLSGYFDRVINHLPKGIAAGMLAGILFRFGTDMFVSIKTMPALVLVMLLVYLAFKRLNPRYGVAAVMLTGTAFAFVGGHTDFSLLKVELVKPVFVTPDLSVNAVLSLALPLALVTLTGQFVPGIAVLRASGYTTPASPMVSLTGLGSLLLAPFGSHGVNLAAITAAICTGPEAHADAQRRYVAGIACGVFYMVIGLFGGSIALLFSALPAELIAALAGLALITAIANGLVGIVRDEAHTEASVITFLATASGITFLGLGSAFWGLMIGSLAYLVIHRDWSVPVRPAAMPATAAVNDND